MKNDKYPKKVAAVKMLTGGRSANSICKELHVSSQSLHLWYSLYQSGGELALLKSVQESQRTSEEKLLILQEIEKNKLSLRAASVKYGIAHSTLYDWQKSYRMNGASGLERKNKSMAKKKAYTQEQLDELEILRRRNEYLEAENALLKKVKALVEEREARLRATGRKPSKD